MSEQEKVINLEKEILETEKEIIKEIKTEEKKLLGIKKEVAIIAIASALVVAGAVAALIYFQAANHKITIDKSSISAPQIDLSAKSSGPLEETMVNIGDEVPANTVVARVGDELIKTKTAGLIIAVKKDIGQLFSPGVPIVSMVDPSELRVVGQIDENKGLADIVVGQAATFTVDAFGSQKFSGIVDQINSSSDNSAVVFSISDKRETKQFDVKIRYNITAYPQFKNGMSAKITIYKN